MKKCAPAKLEQLSYLDLTRESLHNFERFQEFQLILFHEDVAEVHRVVFLRFDETPNSCMLSLLFPEFVKDSNEGIRYFWTHKYGPERKEFYYWTLRYVQ